MIEEQEKGVCRIALCRELKSKIIKTKDHDRRLSALSVLSV